jgi:hypothetical protein
VLEGGIVDHRWDPIINMAAALGFPVGNPRCDWCYATEPESMMQHLRRRHRRPAVRRCRGDLANGGDNIGVYVLHTPRSRS